MTNVNTNRMKNARVWEIMRWNAAYQMPLPKRKMMPMATRESIVSVIDLQII
jgi:hypothetical protein